jgi:hypothetical protein
MKFSKTDPKRRRRTRRDCRANGGYGDISMWRLCTTNFKRERENIMLRTYKNPNDPQPEGGC